MAHSGHRKAGRARLDWRRRLEKRNDGLGCRSSVDNHAQQMVRIDLRTRVLDVPAQDVISRDNVWVKVDAVLYYGVLQPEKAVIQVERSSQSRWT